MNTPNLNKKAFSKNTSLTAALSSLLIIANCAFAETLTVDNRVGSVAMYSDLGTAIAAAASGDTIQLAGSSLSYGSHNIYKTLHFRGPGYLLTNNNVEGMNKSEASVSLSFHNSSTNGNSTGSTVKYLSGSFEVENSDNSLTVSVSECSGFIDSEGNGRLLAARCYIPNSPVGLSNGSTLTDSIVNGVHAENGSVVNRCVFIFGGAVNTETLASISNSIFIVPSSSTLSQFYNKNEGSVANCMAVGASYLPNNNGNLNESFASDVFIQGSSQDGRYQLKAGSPAIGAGAGGVDMGAFGGANPYRLSGVPPIPRITGLTVDAVATDAEGLTFDVDAVAIGTTTP